MKGKSEGNSGADAFRYCHRRPKCKRTCVLEDLAELGGTLDYAFAVCSSAFTRSVSASHRLKAELQTKAFDCARVRRWLGRAEKHSRGRFGIRDSDLFRISDFGFRICHRPGLITSLLCSLLLLLSLPARAADDVVVVFNRKVPESKPVADYYAQRRQVPDNQVIGFDLPASESISRSEYNDQLRAPLLKALVERKLLTLAEGPAATNRLPVAARIRYVALCYGVPLKIKHDPGLNEPAALKLPEGLRRNDAAVDSELACLPGSLTNYLLAGVLGNPFYGATNAAAMHPTNGLLLVARLDGPTPEIARGLVDKALEAETNGLWGRAYVDIRNTTNADYRIAAAAASHWSPIL
jgi:hypothetical protein